MLTRPAKKFPSVGRYIIVTRMTSYNSGPLSLGPIPSGRLEKLGSNDKWSSQSVALCYRYDCFNSILSGSCRCGWKYLVTLPWDFQIAVK